MERVSVDGGTGSIGADGTIVRPEVTPGMSIALATGQLRRPLRESLRPLLDLLADGDYEVHGPEPLPEGVKLVPTDDWPPGDGTRVTYYRTAIRTSHKPVAVLLMSGDSAHILDGHHKIAAYEAEGTSPTVVILRALKEL